MSARSSRPSVVVAACALLLAGRSRSQAAAPVGVLCLGESVTACGSELQARLDRLVKGRFLVIDDKLPAAFSAGVVDRFRADADTYRPRIVVAMMGSNDEIVRNFFMARAPDSLARAGLLLVLRSHPDSRVSRMAASIFGISWSEIGGGGVAVMEQRIAVILRRRGLSRLSEPFALAAGRTSPEFCDYYIDTARERDAAVRRLEAWWRGRLASDPGDARAAVALAQVLERAGRLPEAEQLLARAAATASGDQAKLAARICADYLAAHPGAEKVETAMERSRKAAGAEDSLPLELADSFNERGRGSEALRMLGRLAPGRRTAGYYARLSYALFLVRRPSEALAAERLASAMRLKAPANHMTEDSYRQLARETARRGIALVCMQYPFRPVEELRRLAGPVSPDVVFVDNQGTFLKALERGEGPRVFVDAVGGDYGHMTAAGKSLASKALADAIVARFSSARFVEESESYPPGSGLLFFTARFAVFFALVYSVYWLVLRTADHRLDLLLLASYAFYATWGARFVALLATVTVVDYFLAKAIARCEAGGRRRFFLILSMASNLGLLALFKYGDFFLASAGEAARWLGAGWQEPRLGWLLPLGISFYTFESLSYTMDVYWGVAAPAKSLRDYALFVAYFPHLIAGPILRARDFLPQLEHLPAFSKTNLLRGLDLFALGLVKKRCVADRLAVVADDLFRAPGRYDAAGTWFGVVCYAFQIYCDFSAYSDMARGLGRMFGFDIPANFDSPYLSRDLSEFWRRWHVTLSSWLRDYLFIPLQAARPSRRQLFENLMLTMLLGGLWHGANWTFLVWGAYHGLMLAASAAAAPYLKSKAIVARLLTFASVCVGWVFFRAQSLSQALSMLERMFFPRFVVGASPFWHPATVSAAVLVALVVCYDVVNHASESSSVPAAERWRSLPAPVPALAYAGALMILLFGSPEARVGLPVIADRALAVVTPGNGSAPFIYFQF